MYCKSRICNVSLQKQKNKPDPSGATVISASDNNRLTSIQTTGGNRRLNENNTNNEGNSGLPIQQQEMNDIQVRSSNVVNNAANNHGGNNERHEATIEVAIASPEEDMDPTVGTTSALVNNTSSSNSENQNQQKDNNVSDEVPQVKISNL